MKALEGVVLDALQLHMSTLHMSLQAAACGNIKMINMLMIFTFAQAAACSDMPAATCADYLVFIHF